MKVLLINPRSKNPHEIQQKCFPPVHLLYLASALKEAGFSVEVLDANARGLTREQAARLAYEAKPDLIGVSVLSEILLPVHRLITALKEPLPAAKIVVGGPHANAVPGKILEEFKAVDYVMRGEAEQGLVTLCRALDNEHEPCEVEGLSFRREGTVVHNPPGKPVENLDHLIPPAKELIDDLYEAGRYYMILVKERPIDSLITSRGCPFSCRFCCNTASTYRARSPENVLEEIVESYKKGIRNFDIADANFTYDRERTMSIFELIRREKLNLSFRFKSRADSIDREMMRKAKEAGAYLVSLGMESGAQEILKRMHKGTNIEQNIRACTMVMEAGLKLNTGWIIGYPGETPETIEETISMIVRIKPTTANIGALIPYPGTKVYEEARQEGTLIGDWSINMSSLPWVQLPWTDEYADLERWVSRARRRVYYRPHYAFNFAREIISNSNALLGRYAMQELGKSLRG